MGNLFGRDSLTADQVSARQRLEFADACLVKANAARELGDHIASLGWQEQSLLVRTDVLGDSISVNYNQPYIANIIAIGETHLALRRFDRALVYFLRAKTVLDPLMVQRSTAHTSAPIQYVNLTAGLALVLSAVAKNNHRPTLQLLEGENPLRVAEQVVEQAVIRIVGVEGARAPLLVSLYHILARIYLMTNKRMAALRVMQRCLGLTVHISQTKKIFSFLSYTRNVLDIIKELTLVERVVIRIQQWYRDRIAMREMLRERDSHLHITLTGAEGSHIGGGARTLHQGVRDASSSPFAGRSPTKPLPGGTANSFGARSTSPLRANNNSSSNDAVLSASQRALGNNTSGGSAAANVDPQTTAVFQAATKAIISSLDPHSVLQLAIPPAGGAGSGAGAPAAAAAGAAAPAAAKPGKKPLFGSKTVMSPTALFPIANSPSKSLLQFAESYTRHSDVLKATSSAHFLPSPALLHAIDQSDHFKDDAKVVQRRLKAAASSAATAARIMSEISKAQAAKRAAANAAAPAAGQAAAAQNANKLAMAAKKMAARGSVSSSSAGTGELPAAAAAAAKAHANRDGAGGNTTRPVGSVMTYGPGTGDEDHLLPSPGGDDGNDDDDEDDGFAPTTPIGPTQREETALHLFDNDDKAVAVPPPPSRARANSSTEVRVVTGARPSSGDATRRTASQKHAFDDDDEM